MWSVKKCGGVLALLFVVGCGGAPAIKLPDLYPVSGSVLLDGKPLAQAMVTFVPLNMTKGQGAYASTDDSGNFKVAYPANNKPGCPQGEYKVMIQKLETPDGSPLPPGKSAADAGARNIIPAKYSQMSDRINVIQVPSGGKADLKFELKRK